MKVDEEQELRNISGALITVAFYGQIESIIDSIESIQEQVKSSCESQEIDFENGYEKDVLFKSIMRGIEMRYERGAIKNAS